MPQFTQLVVATPPHSPTSDNLDEFENDSGTFYDDDQDFIRVITGESIPQPFEFPHITWGNMPDNEYMTSSYSNGYHSTASKKQFLLHDDKLETEKSYLMKHPRNWAKDDVIQWTISLAQQYGYNYEQMPILSVNINGSTLCRMSEDDFFSLDHEFGQTLYLSLQSIINEMEFKGILPTLAILPSFDSIMLPDPYPTLPGLADDHGFYSGSQSNTSDMGSDKESESNMLEDTRPKKRPPGRPRGIRSKRKPEKKCGRLWEFIRDLLLNREYCPSLICWDDYDQGVFRFVCSDKVAQLWGTIKENPRMNYEKLSRAMRYYYKSKVLQPVLGRRLVYKFGPTATGWRTPNPNFRLNK